MCEVQIDATHFEHFKYAWNALGRVHKLFDLRNVLKEKLRNRDLFIEYSLFDSKPSIIPDDDNRFLMPNDRFSLKTKDGGQFYAQSRGNKSNKEILKQLSEEQKKISDEFKHQMELNNQMNLKIKGNYDYQKSQEKLQREIEQQMKQRYDKLSNKNVEQYYIMIKTQKCKFVEKTDIIKKHNAKYQRLYKKLKKEYDRLQKCHPQVRNDPNIKHLVLLGKTGDGKSTFGNRLCGDKSKYGHKGPFKAKNNTLSVTKEIKKEIVEMQGHKIAVVDTPGIFDSEESDYQNAIDLVRYLKGCGGVNTFIVIAKPPRLDMAFQQMLKNLHDMLGTEFWNHLIFVITHLSINVGNDNDGEVKKNEEDEDDDAYSDEDLPPPQWLTDFGLSVRGKLSLPKRPICIGVENRDKNSYTMAIEQLLEKIANEKFNCDRLKSPYDTDKIKCQEIYDEMQSQMHFRQEIKDGMLYVEKRIDEQIRELQNNDANYRPSFKELNVERETRCQLIDFHDVSIIDRNDNENEIKQDYIQVTLEEKVPNRNFVDNNIVFKPNVIGISDKDHLLLIDVGNDDNPQKQEKVGDDNNQYNIIGPGTLEIGYNNNVGPLSPNNQISNPPKQETVMDSLPLRIFGDDQSKFMCEQCNNVPLRVASCNMGHIFCRKCIVALCEANELCPADKRQITQPTLNNPVLEHMISREKVSCLYGSYNYDQGEGDGGNTKKGDECPWEGTVSQLFIHLKDCEFKPIKCSFDEIGCNYELKNNDQQKQIIINKMNSHYNEYIVTHQDLILGQMFTLNNKANTMQREITELRSIVMEPGFGIQAQMNQLKKQIHTINVSEKVFASNIIGISDKDQVSLINDANNDKVDLKVGDEDNQYNRIGPLQIGYNNNVGPLNPPKQENVMDSLPLRIFSNDSAAKFGCEQCNNVPLKVASCNMGHIFCRKCIVALCEANELCPADKTIITQPTLNNPVLDHMISRQKISCLYGSHNPVIGMGMIMGSKGNDECSWEGTVSELFAHLKDCRFKPIKCPFNEIGCNDELKNNDEETIKMKAHYKEYIVTHQNLILGQIFTLNNQANIVQCEMTKLRAILMEPGSGIQEQMNQLKKQLIQQM